VSNPAEIDEFLKEYGKDGMRLLVLFSLLKSKVKLVLQQQPTLPVPENTLDRLCMAKASELLRLGKDVATEKDIEELLSRLNEKRET
jgi:hypothetical protein